MRQFPVLLQRRLQPLQGRQSVRAPEQPLSYRRSHLVRRRYDDLHGPERLGDRRHLLQHQRRGKWRVRRARHLRRVHTERALHSNRQTVPAGHHVVRDRTGMRGPQQHQRGSALRSEPRMRQRRVRCVRRDVMPQWMLRQHRVRDHRAEDERVRQGRCSVRRLPGQPDLHDRRQRLHLPVVEPRLLRRRVHEPAKRPKELRRVRERLQRVASRERSDHLQRGRLFGPCHFVRERLDALLEHRECGLRNGHQQPDDVRQLRDHVPRVRAALRRSRKQLLVRDRVLRIDSYAVQRRLRRYDEQLELLRQLHRVLRRRDDLPERPVQVPERHPELRGHVRRYHQRPQPLRQLHDELRRQRDLPGKRVRLLGRSPRLQRQLSVGEPPE